MDRFETLDVAGWAPAIEGMRSPYKSYDRADSQEVYYDDFRLGEADYKLAKGLCQAGPEHRKWMRQIQVWVKISQPLYWFSEFDTYKIGTVANSESTMHTLMKRPLTLQDFDTEYVSIEGIEQLENTIFNLNTLIDMYPRFDDNEEKEKLFINIKSLLPTSFIQTRYVSLNYETLHAMYHQRKNHRLPQWSQDFVSWIKTLPYSEFITEEFDS